MLLLCNCYVIKSRFLLSGNATADPDTDTKAKPILFLHKEGMLQRRFASDAAIRIVQ